MNKERKTKSDFVIENNIQNLLPWSTIVEPQRYWRDSSFRFNSFVKVLSLNKYNRAF